MAFLGRRQPFHERRLSSLVYGATFTAYTLACAAGAYTVTGADAGLKAGRKVSAAAGSYAVSGASAGLKSGHNVAASAGSYTLTGADAGLKAGRILAPSAGSYVINGSAATLTKTGSYALVLGAGTYTYTGTAAGLQADRTVSAGVGAYTYTGIAAGLTKGRKVSSSAGAYALSGGSVTLVKTGSATITASAGSYTTTGSAVTLRRRAAPGQGSGRRLFVPFVPLRVPMLNPHLPEGQPNRELVSRVWLQFFLALREAVLPEQVTALTAQGAAIAPTMLAGVPVAGLYQVSGYVRVTTPASVSSSVQVTIGWTDGGVAQSTSTAALTGNLTTTQESLNLLVKADGGTDITYAVAYSSVGTAMAYALSLVATAVP